MRILVSPLDWGLGHATRLCPIIDYLKLKHDVIIAASGRGYSFYVKRYKENLQILRIPTLPLRYGKGRRSFKLSLLFIGLKLLVNFLLDRLWLNFYLHKRKVDYIISDNRFGLFWSRSKTLFISHHLNPIIPFRFKNLKKIVIKIYQSIVKKYDFVLIPDNEQESYHLTGSLSYLPNRFVVKYIGLLSRFYNLHCQEKNQYEVVAVISGLEPHRQLLLQKITEQLKFLGYKSLIIGGKPETDFDYTQKQIRIVSHLDDEQFCAYILGARVVIARAGYSTIMDLIALGKSGIIIPTPGQTEQEYIAQQLQDKEFFLSEYQDKLNLSKKIKEFLAKKHILEHNVSILRPTLSNFKIVFADFFRF